jgi:hypothetical protein
MYVKDLMATNLVTISRNDDLRLVGDIMTEGYRVLARGARSPRAENRHQDNAAASFAHHRGHGRREVCRPSEYPRKLWGQDAIRQGIAERDTVLMCAAGLHTLESL